MRIEFKGKLNSLSITAAETLNQILIIDEFGLKNRRESFSKSWLLRESY